MAASITLSAVTVGADGRTITATLAGGSAPYTVTDASGFVLELVNAIMTNPTLYLTGASITGSTLTLTTTTTIGTGEVVRLTVPSSGTNLTDSASNTPTGQANLAATNSSAVTVRMLTLDDLIATGAVEANGLHVAGDLSSYQANAGTWTWKTVNSAGRPAGDAALELVTDATDIAVVGYSGAGQYASLDDGAYSAAAPAQGFWSVKPITGPTPLAAGSHLLQLFWDNNQKGLRLAGGTRAISGVIPTAKATPISVVGITPTTVAAVTPVATSGAYTPIDPRGGVQNGNVGGAVYEFGFTGTGVEWAGVLTGTFAVEVDGVKQPALVNAGGTEANIGGYATLVDDLPYGPHTLRATLLGTSVNAATYGFRVLNSTKTSAALTVGATSLTVAKVATLHVGDWIKIDRYEKRERRRITAISGSTITLNEGLALAHTSGVPVTSYAAPAGSFTPWRRNVPTRRLVCSGDSNSQGMNEYGSATPPVPSPVDGLYYGFYDARQSPMNRAAEQLGMEVINLALQGTTTATQVGTATSIMSMARGSFDVATIWPGVNDINQGTLTIAAFKANVQSIITTLLPGLRAGGRILLLPPGNPTGTTSGGLNLATARQALRELAAENPSTTFLENYLAGLSAGDYFGLHYYESGRRKLAEQLIRPLSGLYAPPVGAFFGA